MSDLRSQLQAVYDDRGRLTPQIVVDAARPADHPLHGRFEWDDTIAGEAWRRYQAHELIQSVRIVVRKATEQEAALTVRGFHAIRGDDGYVYEPNDRIIENAFLTELLLRDMEREWRQLQERWRNYQEFVDMVRRDVNKAA
jgi:hypothetical protein